jgi:hypothetical protein
MNNIKKYPCIESTLDFSIKDYKVRLWINEETLKDVDNEIIENVKNFNGDKVEIIEWCAANIPNINAVQVIGSDGRGIVAYTVDFAEDLHG